MKTRSLLAVAFFMLGCGMDESGPSRAAPEPPSAAFAGKEQAPAVPRRRGPGEDTDEPPIAHVGLREPVQVLGKKAKVELQKVEVAYGEDGRDPTAVKSAAWPDKRRSIGAIFRKRDTTTNGTRVVLSRMKLGEKMPDLCPNEKFGKQPVGAICTAFLVKPDRVLTADHCLEAVDAPTELVVAFGYVMLDENTVVPSSLPRTAVFDVDGIVDGTTDWVLLKLKGAVPQTLARPLDIREEDVAVGGRIYTAGCPSGLPVVPAVDARVLRTEEDRYFRTDLDAFQGNSGSPVFDEQDKIVGLLLEGERDYTFDEQKGCTRVAVCSESNPCKGELVVKASSFREKIR